MNESKMKNVVDDYDFINRMLTNSKIKPEHDQSIIRCIELFMEKHKSNLQNPEMNSFLHDLSTRLTQKFNHIKFSR